MEETNAGGENPGTQEPLEFELQVIVTDATEVELDQMTRNLLSELRKTDVESASLVSIGSAPDGTKGDPITIGTLAMTALPAVLPGVIDMIKGWTARREGRSVKFKGKGIEFEGTPEELEKILATLDKIKRRK
jgi:hypothetical protein